MNIESVENINRPKIYKNLFIFVVASASLIVAGFLLNPTFGFLKITLLLWLNFSGLYLIYRLNDFIDAQPERKLNFRQFFADKKHFYLTLQLFLVSIPLAIFILDSYCLLILSFASLIGLLYSIQFRFGSFAFRLKNVFLLKNILIGAVWGSLVLIGFGRQPTIEVIQLFLFVSVQVVIGSIIRDVPDVENDKTEGVNSLPVVLGKPATFVFMHTLNFSTLFTGMITSWEFNSMVLISVIVFWRFLNLIFVAKNSDDSFRTQKMNLVTCVLIALILLIQVVYSYYV